MFRLKWACVFFAMLAASQIAFSEVALASATEEEIRGKLSQPIAFEFKCEPLRPVIKFMSKITGIDIRMDKNIFKLRGKSKDCYGNAVKRKEIFVTARVKNITLEAALKRMLQKHGLGFVVRGDHIYITTRGKLGKLTPQASSVDAQTEAE